MAVFSKQPKEYLKLSVYTDCKYDDLIALLVLLTHLKGKAGARIQIVACDVHDTEGLKNFCARAVRETGFDGAVTYAKEVEDKFARAAELKHKHEELFALGKDEQAPEWSPLIPCDDTWGAIVLAPTSGTEWAFANAGFTFHALGHNYTSSEASDNQAFGPKQFNYTYKNAVSMNNFSSYDGPEGGRFSKQQMNGVSEAFPIAKESLKFAIRNSVDFMAKQTVKALVKYGIPVAEGAEYPTDEAEQKAFMKKWTAAYAEALTVDHGTYLDLVETQLYPAMLQKKADGAQPKPVPSLDSDGNVKDPTREYLDRVWEQMKKGVEVEVTDGQHMLVLLGLPEKFEQAYAAINPKTKRLEFFDGSVSSTCTVARGLKRALVAEKLKEFTAAIEGTKRCRLQ